MLSQRQAERESEKLIMIWRETGPLPILSCCRLRPGVLLFQVPSFPTFSEVFRKSQNLVPEVRNLPLTVSGVSRCRRDLRLSFSRKGSL